MRGRHTWSTIALTTVLVAGLNGIAHESIVSATNNKDDSAAHYASIDVPGATFTSAQGINARGDIVGFYVQAGVTHGYVLSEGTITTIDYPGALYTDARGINAQGDVVGAYRMAGEPAVNFHGYLRNRHGEFSPVDFPGHTNTIPQRITSTGLILGCRHDNDLMTTMTRTLSWEPERRLNALSC